MHTQLNHTCTGYKMCAQFKVCTISVVEYHQNTLGDHGAYMGDK